MDTKKKYRVNWVQITHSRYGKYLYKQHDIVEASSAQEAKQMILDEWAVKEHHGHYKVKILDVIEKA